VKRIFKDWHLRESSMKRLARCASSVLYYLLTALFHANSKTQTKKARQLPKRERQISVVVRSISSNEQAHFRRSSAIRQQSRYSRNCIVIQVSQYPHDHHRVLNAGNDPDITTALTAGFIIDKVN